MRVKWDPAKDLANQRKHNVSFGESVSFGEAAELLTSGRDYLEVFDARHSDLEDRFIAIGSSRSVHRDRFIAIGVVRRGVVLVVWTERDEDVIRVISARCTTSRERQMHWVYLERGHE